MNHLSLNQLKDFHEKIGNFSQPEELFGDLGSTPSQQSQQLEASFRSLMQLYHPDIFVRQPAELFYVTEIAKCINAFHEQAMAKIKVGTYGCDIQGMIQTSCHDYFVTDLLVEGAFADIYQGYYTDRQSNVPLRKDVVIKIISDSAWNSLVDREVAFYRKVAHFCFPGYIEDFRTPQGKKGIVLTHIAGGYDLIELLRMYKQKCQSPGLSQEHLFWILDRFLSALGFLHQRGILHGNLQPDNLMIQPSNHNGLLIDFLHCRIDPLAEDVFAVVNPAYCAPEVLTRRFKPHPVSDIFSLGVCMIEMLGGRNGRLEEAVDLHPSLRRLLQKMVLPDPAKRADDAWALAAELKKLRQQLYGAKPNFIPLTIGGSHGRR